MHNPHDWISQAAKLRDDGAPFVIATIITAQGSAPQPAGSKMLVTENAAYGTVGGGKLELQTLQAARQLLTDETTQNLRIWNLSATMGQCCGGKVALLLEKQSGYRPTVAIFGLGHIGSEVATLAARLPYRVIGVDSRPDYLSACGAPITRWEGDTDRIAALPADSVILIMTHSHQLDFDLCMAALQRGDFSYVGIIGSATKARRFRHNLQQRGIHDETLVCPIGKPSGTHPTEIAAAIVGCIVTHFGDKPSPTDNADDAKRNMQLLQTLQDKP